MSLLRLDRDRLAWDEFHPIEPGPSSGVVRLNAGTPEHAERVGLRLHDLRRL